jgi:hypothetical protein
MPTTADYLTDLVNQKNALADNLADMGVSANSTETLNTLVPKVLTIDQNSNVATGSVNFAQDSFSFQISGLKFTPKYICIMSNIASAALPPNATTFYFYSVNINMNSNRRFNYAAIKSDGDVSFARVSKETNDIYNFITVSDGGFNFDAATLSTVSNGDFLFVKRKIYTWFACA